MSSWTPTRYKTTNWSSYNSALKRRGSLTIWLDPSLIWSPPPSGKRGRQQAYSDAAIQVCLYAEGAVWHAVAAGNRLCRKPARFGGAELGGSELQHAVKTLLKTGCRIEAIRLTTADRLANCIALCCVVAWRISWLTMLRRQFPGASPAAVFTDTERVLLNRTIPSNRQNAPRNMAFYMTAVARLGGYLVRSE